MATPITPTRLPRRQISGPRVLHWWVSLLWPYHRFYLHNAVHHPQTEHTRKPRVPPARRPRHCCRGHRADLLAGPQQDPSQNRHALPRQSAHGRINHSKTPSPTSADTNSWKSSSAHGGNVTACGRLGVGTLHKNMVHLSSLAAECPLGEQRQVRGSRLETLQIIVVDTEL
ncbi:hypothetical protein M427DRAFT_326139 [Gonapodya prolifera JEL478]|uniref:Uncharacterized protein n=1 Tax=Gonapodya prolifera (strain JEL478) TaxID=1344416 RepID=A0A139AFL7_GONPJ|nr:hypothetical protein M427DRAFT_326139 [Gonapodya prolifera JEL478]|eukprot:KXS15203.1 hypothetical protein M427DRAFT_326139 [Gonapodya prolifera JEL478]